MDQQSLLTFAALLQASAMIGGGFYFTGRITTVLEELKVLAKDHENRLRTLEAARRRPTDPGA